jgi:hypothetical protein
MVLPVGRHELASGRRKPPIALAAVIVPVAVLFAVGASTYPLAGKESAGPAADDVAPCCMKVVAATSAAPLVDQSGMRVVSTRPVSASRWRVVEIPRFLPVGVAPERGLQVRTILAARSISAAFPDIHEIGGVRADAMRWHPDGLALDVTIPNPGSAEGIALGNKIVAFALENADRFGLQDAIWRGVYYTPSGPQGTRYGHYDHVHITTTGGGYPTGTEIYLR